MRIVDNIFNVHQPEMVVMTNQQIINFVQWVFCAQMMKSSSSNGVMAIKKLYTLETCLQRKNFHVLCIVFGGLVGFASQFNIVLYYVYTNNAIPQQQFLDDTILAALTLRNCNFAPILINIFECYKVSCIN